MALKKTYTDKNNPEHPLIRAAVSKGLTNVTFEWYASSLRMNFGSGWFLSCDQVYTYKFYEGVPAIVKRIRSGALSEDGKRFRVGENIIN